MILKGKIQQPLFMTMGIEKKMKISAKRSEDDLVA